MEKKKVGVIGCGALGQIFLKNFGKVLGDSYMLLGATDLNRENMYKICGETGCKAYADLAEMLADGPDFVAEIAGAGAVKAYGERVLASGADLIIVSIGALEDEVFRNRLERTAREKSRKIYLPCGAIGGYDVLRTMHLMGPMEISIDNVKAPGSLNGAPYLNGQNLPEDTEKLVFEGSVHEAIQGFPKNVNVAVASSLASGQPDEKVLIRSVPGLTENCHSVHAVSSIADVTLTFKSSPDPENPKSSTITAWSALALLKNLADTIQYF